MVRRYFGLPVILAALTAVAPLLPLSTTAQPPTAAPPGSPGLYFPGQRLETELQAAVAHNIDPALAELIVTDQYAIHEVHRSQPAPPAIHLGWTELHFVLQGGGTLVTGGRIVSVGGKTTVEGGTSQQVKKGDAMLVPANTPHMYSRVDGTLTYLEVRFVAPSVTSAEK